MLNVPLVAVDLETITGTLGIMLESLDEFY